MDFPLHAAASFFSAAASSRSALRAASLASFLLEKSLLSSLESHPIDALENDGLARLKRPQGAVHIQQHLASTAVQTPDRRAQGSDLLLVEVVAQADDGVFALIVSFVILSSSFFTRPRLSAPAE